MKFITAVVVSSAFILSSPLIERVEAAVPVVWDGSAGFNTTYYPSYPGGMRRWEEGNWTKNGTPGQTAAATMGDNTGGEGGYDIVIGGGVTVFHDQNRGLPDGVAGGLGDFKPRMDVGGPG